MNTLVLRQVPDHLYLRHKAIANSNRRSMNQETIQVLAAGLPGEHAPSRPDVETSRHWLQRQIWNLPLQGRRSAEAIVGFGDDGLCH
jgi:plasmid stability protein